MYDNLMLLKNIVDNTPLPIAVYTGNELKIELANPAMIKAWGKGTEVIGKKYIEVVPEIENQQIFDQALRVFQTGIPFHAKNKKVELVIDDVLKTFYFNYSFIPLFDNEKKIYGIMNTGADVSDLYEAHKQIQSSDERLRMAIESSGMGTYEIDLSTKKINTNGNFNTIWSIDKEIPNEQLIAKLHPEDQLLREKAHQEAHITGKINYEARIINQDQTVKWIKVNGKLINDQNGIPITIIGIVQDIDQQRQFEQELKKQVDESTQELRRSNEDLMHFANIVSHDLKEPVRKIKTFISLLRNNSSAYFNDISNKYLTKVDQSAQRMQTIIEGILAYSTLDKKTQPIESINLDEVIENIKVDLELIIKEKGAILIKSELPEIEGATILIQQLFYNLIHNALKFSKADQPPRVTISSLIINKDQREFIQINIKDNGIGLDSSHYERIFNAFERLHSKDEYEGNGLGLSLCKKIVLRHGGTITATGEKDNGAEFIVTLPLKQTTNTI
ncbi:PAS domain-containing sensor histidine kinase [Flavobacterium pectinovorum]|uniref:histidine kinase n=1 Tax=Flavobacterium pectinovorum TaxID=29533 RepID=A0AB36NZ73_9FLAO|nr:ATP-binding protein [Flavobacterium pectinovorum]OXB03257.1 PAS domain-containing sensor histidine kinase [Flavobacterium pectinovorum]SHL22185.1 PAS domain S-box-containing protein [Flavobacterium pectinovorum]